MIDAELLKEIDAQRLLMIAVSTGGGSIQSKNDEYIERRDRIREAVHERGLDDPNPHDDLWAWYGKWSSGDLPKWQDRREYVSALYKPLTDTIRSGGRAALLPEPTGWGKVDSILRDIAVRVVQAKSEHDYQTVGLLCREALVALADAVHDPVRHPTSDGTAPSKTDAKRRLDAYIAAELPGSGNEEARKVAKAAVDLANAVQHRQGATLRDAALAAEATNSVVNLVAIIAGRRDKPLGSIREELAERLARAEADAAQWQAKYEGLAGFSAFVTLEGDGVPGTQYVRVVASQDVRIVALDYCIATGTRIVTMPFEGLSGRDVRVPINHPYVELTFRRGLTDGPHIVDIVLRVKLYVGDVLKQEQLSARAQEDVATRMIRLLG